jgi:hypothetical protein
VFPQAQGRRPFCPPTGRAQTICFLRWVHLRSSRNLRPEGFNWSLRPGGKRRTSTCLLRLDKRWRAVLGRTSCPDSKSVVRSGAVKQPSAGLRPGAAPRSLVQAQPRSPCLPAALPRGFKLRREALQIGREKIHQSFQSVLGWFSVSTQPHHLLHHYR